MIAPLVSPSLAAFLLAAPGIRLGYAIVRRIGRRFCGIAIVTACLAPVATCSLPTPAYAEPVIAWGSAQNISGDSDVSTNGTLLYAYNFGTASVASTTVNGVTFAPFVVLDFGTTTTVGNVTITESPDFLYAYNTAGTSIAPFANLSSAYKALLNEAASAGVPATITLQLGGLTPGQSYEFQWWANNSSTAERIARSMAPPHRSSG
jgi:hypothetical protein